MADNEPKKHRIYIVGGKGRNLPTWLSSAFEWEQFHQDKSKTRDLEPNKVPDAIVVLSSWIGHEHFYGARDLSEKLDIPLILSPGGWSTSLKSAADLGVEWFIQDIERCRLSVDLDRDKVEEVEEVEEFIDNAWREAYNREWAARQAMERRYSRDKEKFENSQKELSRLTDKGEAAQRVIAEIRLAAATQRAALEEANDRAEQRADETQARSERVASALAQHISSLHELFESADASHGSILNATARLGDARRIAKARIDALRAALFVAEEGNSVLPPEDVKSEDTNSVSASNAGADS